MSKKLGRSFWGLWLFANVIGGICLPILVWQAPYTIKSQIFLNEVLQSIGIATSPSPMCCAIALLKKSGGCH
ncbi:hypothetical protein HCU40_24045 [Pseudanabaena biceps]|nr:hypothetical protein [Pseudanabaena biceps]